jgi:hypothetical protein
MLKVCQGGYQLHGALLNQVVNEAAGEKTPEA